jgi:DNA polymerase-3 subunit epsilon
MIAVDIETSGLDPHTASILSLGAIDTDNPKNQFYAECRAWEGAHIDVGSLAVNGFTEETIRDATKHSEGELMTFFIAWATDEQTGPANRTFIAQNASFDRDFVKAACHRSHIDWPFADRTLDTHTMTWLHMTMHGITPATNKHRSAINLDAALAYCGLPPEPKPHNALTGAQCHAEVFARMAYTKSIIPEFSTFDIPWQTT